MPWRKNETKLIKVIASYTLQVFKCLKGMRAHFIYLQITRKSSRYATHITSQPVLMPPQCQYQSVPQPQWWKYNKIISYMKNWNEWKNSWTVEWNNHTILLIFLWTKRIDGRGNRETATKQWLVWQHFWHKNNEVNMTYNMKNKQLLDDRQISIDIRRCSVDDDTSGGDGR